jgi:methionine synthase I (cobalamin-dependent)
MRSIVALGVEVIGGCCGTDPSFIAGLREAFSDRFPARTLTGARP